MDAPTAQPRLAARSPGAIALFLALTGLMLAGDLTLKYWAFENVAGVPVDIVHSAEQQTAHAYEHAGERYAVLFDDPDRRFANLPTVPVVPGVLNLHLTTNTGAVFGLGKGARWIFIVVSVVAVGVIAWLFARSPADAWVRHTAYALILAGALGNLYDRLRYAAVRDMLHLFPGSGVWPWIFNLADAVLMIGVGLVLLLTFRAEQQQRALQTQPN
jgi:signal peptidase II